MSAISFLYLFTGCLDLGLKEGQKKQRLPQAGKTWRETTPETVLIFEFQYQKIWASPNQKIKKNKN